VTYIGCHSERLIKKDLLTFGRCDKVCLPVFLPISGIPLKTINVRE